MRVLVVDDDPSVRGSVRAGLDPYDVVEAGDGSAALGILRAEPIDVVLLDVTMPGLDGWEVLRRLCDDRADERPAVLMLTGRVSEPDRIRAFRMGADGYLTKPVDPDDLAKAVEESAGRSAEERAAARLEELGRAEFLDRLERGIEDPRIGA